MQQRRSGANENIMAAANFTLGNLSNPAVSTDLYAQLLHLAQVSEALGDDFAQYAGHFINITGGGACEGPGEARTDYLLRNPEELTALGDFIDTRLPENVANAQEYAQQYLDMKNEDPEYVWERFEELYELVENNPNFLITVCPPDGDDTSIDEQDYAHLFNHLLPQACTDRLSALGDGFSYQDLDDADSPSINMDHYSTEISAIPDFDGDGIPDESNVLFEKIRENFLSLASGSKDDFESNCTFGGTPDIWWSFQDYPGFNSPSSTERWLGADPVSTIFLIDAGGTGTSNLVADLGAVMVSDITGCCWMGANQIVA